MTTTLEETTDTTQTTEAQETPSRSLWDRIAGLSARDRVLIGGGVGVAVFAWVLASVFTGGETASAEQVAAVSPDPQQDLQGPAVQLTAAEYLELGRGAVKESRFIEARGFIEQALASGPTDLGVRSELCWVMADVCHRMGQPDAAALYREEASSIMSGLDGTALLVFQLAEADLAAGNIRDARRRYHAIALGSGQPGGADARLRAESERRLAKTYEAEFKASRSAPLDQISDPKVFVFEGDR